MKSICNRLGYWLVRCFGARIRDERTNENLGKALVLACGRRVWVIGYQGEKPLLPVFLAEKKLCYWRQKIGFTTHDEVDFGRVKLEE